MATHAQQIANSGKLFESQIRSVIDRCGYTYCDRDSQLETPYYKTQFAHSKAKSLYGKSMRADFFCWHPVKWPNGLIIEAKYQAVGGSVDEKYPYTVLSLKQIDFPSVIIFEGGGATRSAIEWAVSQADNKKHYSFDGISEFIRAANKGLL